MVSNDGAHKLLVPKNSQIKEPKNIQLPPPKPVTRSFMTILSDILIDVLLLGLSLAFFAFGLIVRSYDQAPIASYPDLTKTLVNATKYGPSVFPILFACVVGRLAHSILLWKLGKGAKIGTLDLLAGSTSLTSTVTTQFKLRIASILGVVLICIWILSPIGGQASLRVMTTGTKIDTTPTSFEYMVADSTLEEYMNSERASLLAVVNALFVASVIAPDSIKSSTVDTWGNVKIPLVEHYENSTTPDEQGWYNVGDENSHYSSLVGVPISSIRDRIAYTLNIQTKYFYVDCPIINQTTIIPNDPEANTTTPQVFTGTASALWSMDNTTARYKSDPTKLSPRTFAYFISHQDTGYCNIITTYVEAEIKCQTKICTVSRIRRSKLDHLPSAFTFDVSIFTWSQFASAFIDSIQAHPEEPTPIQSYMVNPDNPLVYQAGNGAALGNISSLSRETYSLRLMQLMNGYWDCLNGRHVIASGVSPSTAILNGENYTANIYPHDNATTADGTMSESIPVIVCHTSWMIVLLLASIVLAISAIVNAVVCFWLVKVPDVMLNVSSLATRNNQYIDVQSLGTYVGASDRAKRVKNLKVQFGDVESSNDVGKLAIALVDEKERHVVGVRKRRLYE